MIPPPGDPKSAETPAPAPVQTATTTGMPTPEPASAAISAPTAAVPVPFTIGVMESLTGPGETYGRVAVQAKLMAVDEINAAGGIDGRMLELTIEDSRCNTQDSIAAYRKLTKLGGIKIILGASCSGAMLGVALHVEEDGAVLFSGRAANPVISEAGDCIFLTAMSDVRMRVDTGNLLWAEGIRKLATISEAADYAEGVRRTSVAQFEPGGRHLFLCRSDRPHVVARLGGGQDNGHACIGVWHNGDQPEGVTWFVQPLHPGHRVAGHHNRVVPRGS